jgi:hypothetical protein
MKVAQPQTRSGLGCRSIMTFHPCQVLVGLFCERALDILRKLQTKLDSSQPNQDDDELTLQ